MYFQCVNTMDNYCGTKLYPPTQPCLSLRRYIHRGIFRILFHVFRNLFINFILLSMLFKDLLKKDCRADWIQNHKMSKCCLEVDSNVKWFVEHWTQDTYQIHNGYQRLLWNLVTDPQSNHLFQSKDHKVLTPRHVEHQLERTLQKLLCHLLYSLYLDQ